MTVDTQKALRNANRGFRLLSECSHALVRMDNEEKLLLDICRLIVESGGYRMAWVGYALQNETKCVHPVAQMGFDEGYLESLNLTSEDSERGRGPTGTAIRTGKPVLARNILTDPHFAPWRNAAIARGYASSIALPLLEGSTAFGALNIYSSKPETFDDNEVKLLMDLADDLAFGILTLRTRERHSQTEEELKKTKDLLEMRVLERTKELKESEEKFKTLSEKSMVGIYILRDCQFKYINPAFAQIFDYSPGQLMEKNFLHIVQPADRDKIKEKIEKLMTGSLDYSHSQFQGIQKNGERLYLEVYKARIVMENQPAIIGTCIDATQRKQYEIISLEKTKELENLNRGLEDRINRELEKRSRHERILLQQSKLAAMGEMVGAIAHQWRQPLSTVAMIIQNIEMAYDLKRLDRIMLKNAAKDAMSQIKYMSKTIDDFRNFFNPSKEEEAFCVVRAIEETISIMRPQIENNFIRFRLQGDTAGTFWTSGYPNEFKQVLVNILTNAKNSIEASRQTGLLEKESGEITIAVSGGDGDVFIAIANNGGNIPKTIIDRIFEPYFTTSTDGSGMGIGLYMCKIIIEDQMGGSIWAENQAEGVVFTIRVKGCEKKELPEGV